MRRRTIKVDGVEYEVLWSGGEGLTSITETKPTDFWTPPNRLYNKTGRHSKKKLDNPDEIPQDDPTLTHLIEGDSNDI